MGETLKEPDTPLEQAKIGSITGQMLYEYYKEKLVAKNASIPSLVDLEEGGTYRVTCDRIGSGHGFQGPEVERYDIYCPRLFNKIACYNTVHPIP